MMTPNERIAVLSLAEILIEIAQVLEPQNSRELIWSDRAQSALRLLLDEPVDAPWSNQHSTVSPPAPTTN